MNNPQPVFDQLNLVVRDMNSTLAFYRRLGLTIPDDDVWRTETGAHHARAETPNGAALELTAPRSRSTSSEARRRR